MRSCSGLMVLLLVMVACSSDELPPDEPVTVIEYTYLEHNRWIYEQMNRNYLWREDLPDSVDCNYGLTPPEFFKSILSPRDRFSYLTTNPTYRPGAAQYYGFGYQEYADHKGDRAIQVLYVTSESCRQAGIARGDFYRVRSRSASGMMLRKVLYDAEKGFVETDREVTLPAGPPATTVIMDTVLFTPGGRTVGYLCYGEFDGVSDLHEPLASFRERRITDLVLDLRYNPGGYVSTCQYLCNCIVPESGYGNVFQQCSYNSVLSDFYRETTGDEMTYTFFKAPPAAGTPMLGIGVIALDLPKVYVLTSSHTASASEATIVCLRPYMDVVVIGETTVGKGVGSRNFSDSRFRYALQPIVMRYYNANGETTPDTGLVPDVLVAGGYSTVYGNLGSEEEPLLRTALDLISGESPARRGACAPSGRPAHTLTPAGEPSYVTEFNNKHDNERI